MCGVAGIVGGRRGAEPLQRMLAALRHRGPDDEGTLEVAPGVWLGNRRLAILDLSPAGHMPMVDPGSGCAITYNGEVYNFAELRAELEAQGRPFRSRTDTEVVLAAYVAWGVEAFRRLRGMFALALSDPRRREVVLARDPLGEKPLYYASGPGWFAFASEVRALLASGLPARRLDPRGLGVYLHNGFVVDPITLVEGVRALLPGTWLRVGFDGRVLGQGRFWAGPLRERPGHCAPGPEAIRARFQEAVRLRLVADVPLGAFLSGGLDSTAVVAAMARGGRPPSTFTVAIPGSCLDESGYARAVAAELGTEHREVAVGLGEAESWVADGLGALDQPSFDGINTYLVARAAKEAGLTVALSGLGGDELFGGYPFLRHALLVGRALRALGPGLPVLRRAARLAADAGARKLLAALEGSSPHPALPAYQATQVLFSQASQARLMAQPADGAVCGLPQEFVAFLEEEAGSTPMVERLSHLVLRIFCGQRTLRDSDSVSMAVSLELRPPWLDRVLVEEAFAVSAAKRLREIPDKAFEREVVGPLLPGAFVRRPKQGFTLPFDDWLRPGTSLWRFARARLDDRDLARRAGLRPHGLRELLGRRLPWSRVWALVALLDWVGRTGVEA